MKLQRVLVVLLIAVGAGLGAHGLTSVHFFAQLFEPVELKTLDVRMRNVAQPQPDSSEIAIILFDAASVAEWPYEVPFPRAVLADLIDVISGLGARAIGLDVYLERLYPELAKLDDGDARLRAAMERAGNVILVAPTEQTDTGRVFHPPHPYFAEVAAGIASADLPTPFETVRDAALTVRTDHGLVPGLSLALYAQARGVSIDSMLSRAERTGRLDVPGLPELHGRLPEDGAVQSKPILFVGPPSRAGSGGGAFNVYASNVIQQVGAFAPAEWFEDKIVLLGTGFHAEDRFRSPFYDAPGPDGGIAGWTYGIEVHANALENLLSGRHPVPLGDDRTLMLLILLALLVALATFGRGVSWGAAFAVSLLAADFVLAFYLFDRQLLHLPIVGPTFALGFAFLGSTSYVSLVEGRDKRVMRGAFSKYVSPAVVDELVADPSRIKLGGEKRTVSILFSDLAGFTTLSETMEPEALLALLNHYLDQMADIVLSDGGTLDKYIGDAIMALYGAPTAQTDHAVRVCRTAVRMQRRLRELNEEWRGQGLPNLHMRIGINTGTPVVGNIGGEKRFDYTALGDSVNLAARLEPACKTYGIDTMISEFTREAAGDTIIVREIELLAVKGKERPVRVFELVGMAGDPLGRKAEVIEHYGRGLEAFRNRDFELALQYFQAAAEIDPTDGPTELYLERCRTFIAEPPPADWDYIERRQVK